MANDHPSLFGFRSELDHAVGGHGLAPDLYKDLLARRGAIAQKMLNGNCKSLEAYADAVGGFRQIEWVLGYADRKAKDLERELGTPIEDDE